MAEQKISSLPGVTNLTPDVVFSSIETVDNTKTNVIVSMGDVQNYLNKNTSELFISPSRVRTEEMTDQELISELCSLSTSSGLPINAYGLTVTLTANLSVENVVWLGGVVRGNFTITSKNSQWSDVVFDGPVIKHTGGELKLSRIEQKNTMWSTSQILIRQMDEDGTLDIVDSSFSNGNYGVLHQGGGGGMGLMTRVRLSRLNFNDMNADAIEMNVINGHYQQGGCIVEDITLDNINNTNSQPSWGIGIGFAGKGPYAIDQDETMMGSNIIVRNIRATGTRQCVHFEMCRNFRVENVQLYPDSSASVDSGLDAAGVAVYGCRDFTISGVTGEAAVDNGRMIFIAWGVNDGTYVSPSTNFSISDVVCENSRLTITTAANDTMTNKVSLTDIRCNTLEMSGLPSDLVIDQIHAKSFVGVGDDNKPIIRNAGISARITNVISQDDNGARTGSYSTLYCDTLTTFGCNFDVIQQARFGGTRGALVGNVGNIYYLTSDAFPPGKEFIKNDVLIKPSGGQYVITKSGAYIVSNDQISAAEAGQDWIESNNTRPWGTTSGKSAGTQIVIPGAGVDAADLTTTITRSPVTVSSKYRVSINPAIVTAVPNGTVIKALNPITKDNGYIEIAIPTVTDPSTIVTAVTGSVTPNMKNNISYVFIIDEPLTGTSSINLDMNAKVGTKVRVVRTDNALSPEGSIRQVNVSWTEDVDGTPWGRTTDWLIHPGQWTEAVFDGTKWWKADSNTLVMPSVIEYTAIGEAVSMRGVEYNNRHAMVSIPDTVTEAVSISTDTSNIVSGTKITVFSKAADFSCSQIPILTGTAGSTVTVMKVPTTADSSGWIVV